MDNPRNLKFVENTGRMSSRQPQGSSRPRLPRFDVYVAYDVFDREIREASKPMGYIKVKPPGQGNGEGRQEDPIERHTTIEQGPDRIDRIGFPHLAIDLGAQLGDQLRSLLEPSSGLLETGLAPIVATFPGRLADRRGGNQEVDRGSAGRCVRANLVDFGDTDNSLYFHRFIIRCFYPLFPLVVSKIQHSLKS